MLLKFNVFRRLAAATLLVSGVAALPDYRAGAAQAPVAPVLEAPIAPLLEGLGTHEWAVTSSVPPARQFFNQGVLLLYGFNHPEALRSFREAARLDPKLAMAFWGQAMAVGPNLNAPLSAHNARQAYDAIQSGRRAGNKIPVRTMKSGGQQLSGAISRRQIEKTRPTMSSGRASITN